MTLQTFFWTTSASIVLMTASMAQAMHGPVFGGPQIHPVLDPEVITIDEEQVTVEIDVTVEDRELFFQLKSLPAVETEVYENQQGVSFLIDGQKFVAYEKLTADVNGSTLSCIYGSHLPSTAPINGQEFRAIETIFACDVETEFSVLEFNWFDVEACASEHCTNPAIIVGNLSIDPEYEGFWDNLGSVDLNQGIDLESLYPLSIPATLNFEGL